MVLELGNISITQEEIEELARRVRLKILHEDDDIVLMTAPNEDQLASIIKELISIKPLNLREIHAILSGIASEDKIRRALNNLLESGEAYINSEGRYLST
ncbi:MAG: ArsR family transcriptional regulator [Thermosphaera sp.]|uniref:ArsR family transcriptional regulator n=1 Tax=Thermosphaera chiliense TaxID=3402707 RepID=UPI001D0B8FC2|nr:ArsR family transcriptional regulator [Thermosphaera aggregans]